MHLVISTSFLKEGWWHSEQHSSFLLSLCFYLLLTLLFKHRLWLPVTLFSEVEGAALTLLDFNNHRHQAWRSVRDKSVPDTPSTLVRVQVYMEIWGGGLSVCIMCMRVCGWVGGWASPLRENGITSCLHCISTCQPAAAKERSDSLWRLASTPPSMQMTDTRAWMNINTHTYTHSFSTDESGHILCCTMA